MRLEDLVKELSYYSIYHLGRDKIDQVYLENLLLDEFNLSFSSKKAVDINKIKGLSTPDYFILSFTEKLLVGPVEELKMPLLK